MQRGFIVAAMLAAAGVAAGAPGGNISPGSPEVRAFQAKHPGSGLYWLDGRITTVYGRAFSDGASAVASAEAFVREQSALLGAARGELVPGTLATDGAVTRQVMFDGSGRAKFTVVSRVQERGGIPVFRAELRMFVRNDPGFPLVLAKTTLRDLGDFAPDGALAANPNVAAAFESASDVLGGITGIDDVRVVIWAGVDSMRPAPVLAVSFIATQGEAWEPGYQRRLFVADAASGDVLWSEDQVRHVDVTGTLTCVATPGKKADICATETTIPMPYGRVAIGATVAYADVNGNYTIPNAGSGSVTVSSGVRGKYFRVYSPSADATVLSQSVTPPGPANFTHNSANNTEKQRAEVNAYVQANVVRDFALAYLPTFPTIAGQTEFRTNVMIASTCNAYYDGTSINFYSAGGGCADTAYGDVVHHEYGHHMVQCAGSGQDAYGEGFGDLMGVMISDEPILGYGFQNNCSAGIRTASNSVQYPCSDEIHACGQLLSGAFWETRNELLISNPSDYRSIISSLAVNSVIAHAGSSSIAPDITIDVLTLDDNDANISNGTPHYQQIATGFGEHNLDAPPLDLLAFSYPLGKPSVADPFGGTTVRVQVSALAGTPQAGTGVLYVDPENDGTFQSQAMAVVGPNLYEGTFPAIPCGSAARWYVSAKTTANATDYDPSLAPADSYTVIGGSSSTVAFSDNFQTNKGWSVTTTATDGPWTRGTPVNGGRGDPPSDYDGSGMCYVTDNVAGNSDVDGGSTTLTSPTMNATGGDEAILSYARWFSNSTGDNPNTDAFVVQVSNNNGSSWVGLETVGPTGPERNGGWYAKSFKLSPVLPLTSQMKVRFTASDDANGSIVEAGVDAVSLTVITCTTCPADFNGDGFLNGDDFDDFVAAFEAGDPSADYDGDGFVTGEDFDSYNEDFALGC